MERTIAAAWQRLSGVEQVSIDDNFFDAGGTSLLLVQLHLRLVDALRLDFPLVTLFEHSTVRALAQCLEGPGPGSAAPAADLGQARQARVDKQKQALARMLLRSRKP